MRLLLSTAKRSNRRPWVCLSCRNASLRAISREGLAEKTLDIAQSQAKALRAQGPARTRFAPSPTGYLHLGSLRTALFNYLVAKATGGQFLLRIEDTDQKRTVPDAEQRLYEDLRWAGIEWDEGPEVGGPYGPYKQSERTALYRDHADKLLQSGHAYRCFCTPERLNKLAQYRNVEGNPINYDRACYHKYTAEQSAELTAQGTPHIIRLKSPKRYPLFHDLVYGNIFKRKAVPDAPGSPTSYEDPVLMKTDGFPTYHLANVVDDHLMKITHVIRGAEWMSSTPKHLAMYNAFGWTPPKFAHVGLLLDKNRAKLSKRNQDIDIASFRKQGVFPETLTNFVALLGWSHSQSKDMMNLEELIENASMKYTRGDTVVSFEKLWFLQKAHAARYASLPSPTNPSHSLLSLAIEPVMALLAKTAKDEIDVFSEIPEEPDQKAYVTRLLLADAAQYTTPSEFISRNQYFFTAPTSSHLRRTIPLLQLGNKSFITTPLIQGSKALSAGAKTLNTKTLELPASIPVISPREFLAFIAQFGQIEEREWKTDELRNWINTISSQASLTPTLETWRISDEVEREKVEMKLKKAWGKLVHDYLRWALLGGMSGPDSADVMVVLGRKEVLKRLRAAQEIMLRWDEFLEGRNQKKLHEELEKRAEWERLEAAREKERTKEMEENGML